MSDRPSTATALRERSIDAYRQQARFRGMVDHIVHDTMQRHKIKDEMTYEPRDLHELLTDVAAQVLKGVYEGDAELQRLETERDHALTLARDALSISPARPFFVASDPLTASK